MNRLLVVSPRSSLAVGLSTSQWEVTHASPVDLDTWIGQTAGLDALVVEATDSDAGRELLGNIRARGVSLPTLVVLSTGGSGAMTDVAWPVGSRVLTLPVSRPALLAALDELVQLVEPMDPVEQDMPRGAPPHVSVPPQTRPSAQQVAPPVAPPSPTPPNGARRLMSAWSPLARPSTSPPEPAPGPAASEPTPARTPAAAPPPPAPAPGRTPVPRLVEELILAAPTLSTVAEVAGAVLTEALHRTDAEKGALLLQDGDNWRVAAGHGLRALEYRIELPGDSWAVDEVVRQGHGVIVEDTDIARHRLRGLPLASAQNLLLAPIPRVDALVVLSRDDSVFTEAALIALVTLSEEGGDMLHGALQLRELARLLAPYTDSAD